MVFMLPVRIRRPRTPVGCRSSFRCWTPVIDRVCSTQRLFDEQSVGGLDCSKVGSLDAMPHSLLSPLTVVVVRS